MKIIGSIAIFCGLGIAAFGDSATFTFDKSGAISALTPGNTQSQISTYMTSVLQAAGCIGCTVTVTQPQKGSGNGNVYVDNTYTGDSHVVGPSGNPVTLGTYEHASDNAGTGGTRDLNAAGAQTYDNFISNVSNTPSSGGNGILIQFSTPGYTLSGGVAFDFEIFPDAGCPSRTSCTLPDFIFEAGLNALANVSDFGTAGVQNAAFPGAAGLNGTSTTSPLLTTETAAQWIGTYSSSTFSSSYNQLEFLDWPAAIGVDNLQVNFSRVPEVNSVLLLGTLALLLFPLVRKFRKA